MQHVHLKLSEKPVKHQKANISPTAIEASRGGAEIRLKKLSGKKKGGARKTETCKKGLGARLHYDGGGGSRNVNSENTTTRRKKHRFTQRRLLNAQAKKLVLFGTKKVEW